MKRAFTLIELLIVIAVIAILISIALPRFRGMQEEGFTAKAAGELRSLAMAVESYYIHNSSEYPDQATAVNSTDWQTVVINAAPKIVGTALTDPFKPSQQYSYATDSASASKYYVIFSIGPDATADITAISTLGTISGGPDDDIYFSNGASGTGGF